MRIGQKLILGFLVVVALTAILGILNIVSIQNIGTKTETHSTLHLPVGAAIIHLRVDIEEIMRATEEYDADWMTKEGASEEIKEKKEHVETHLEHLYASGAGLITPEEVKDLEGSIKEFYALSAKLFGLHGIPRAARAPTMAEFDGKVEELDEKLDAMHEKVDEASTASMDFIMSTVASSRTTIISALGVVILAALGTAFAISRSISNPVIKLRDVAIEIGKGDLSKRAQVKSKDEIGDLAASFNQMTDEIQKRNEELQTMNEELQATEEELRASNEELEAANEELREAQEQLVRSERLAAIGQLAGGVGHELRNPLGAIKNAAYYLKGKVSKSDLAATEPRILEFLDIINEEVESSNKIISDLLGFSRVGKPAVSPTRIERVVDEALARAHLPENVELIKELGALPEVPIDSDLIRQVFLNMLQNAQDAMPEGGQLRISAQEKEGFLEVEISDSGHGIPQEILGKIFDPLFTTKAKGIGLGLAVCQTIVERHGGSIGVKSEVGRGTAFTVRLPL